MSNTTAPKPGPPPNPTDAVFFTTVIDAWSAITVWTIMTTALVFLCAGIYALHLNMRYKPEDSAIRVKHKSTQFLSLLWIPALACIVGAGIGFSQGTISAAMISLIAQTIPYQVGIDIAAGLGISQGIVICYFHMGRADFIHR